MALGREKSQKGLSISDAFDRILEFTQNHPNIAAGKSGFYLNNFISDERDRKLRLKEAHLIPYFAIAMRALIALGYVINDDKYRPTFHFKVGQEAELRRRRQIVFTVTKEETKPMTRAEDAMSRT